MRPIQYASHQSFPHPAQTRAKRAPLLSRMMSALLVSVGTFAILLTLAMVAATLMIRS